MARKIGEILVERGLLTNEDVARGLEAKKFYGGRVGSLWVDLGMLEERDLLDALCQQKGAKPVRGSLFKAVTKATLDLIPVKVATRYQVIPLAREARRLTVAMTDPNDLLALDELAFITGSVIEPLLATERTVLSALEAFYAVPRKRRETLQLPGGARPVARAKGSAETDAPAKLPPPLPPVPESTGELRLDDAAQQAARRFWSEGDGAEAADGPAATAPITPLDLGAAATAPGGADGTPSGADTTASTRPLAPKTASAAGAAIGAASGTLDGNDLLVGAETAATQAVAEEEARTLEEASRRLARADVRDDIADVILWCTEGLFRRAALFIFQKSRTLGWTGHGDGLSPNDVRRVVVPVEDVSIFTLVRDQSRHYQGPLPKTPANEKIVATLGDKWPEAVLVIPFGVKGRAIGCLYAEDDAKGLAGIDMHAMFRLLQKAGLAVEMLLIRSKVMML